MKNYLILGGSSGIGLTTSGLLAEKGNTFYASYFSHAPKTTTAGIIYFKYDVNDAEFSAVNLPEVLDGLVYCPGTIQLKPFRRIKPEDFISDYNVQVVGAVKVLQAVVK